jgi:hypothetical protein
VWARRRVVRADRSVRCIFVGWRDEEAGRPVWVGGTVLHADGEVVDGLVSGMESLGSGLHGSDVVGVPEVWVVRSEASLAFLRDFRHLWRSAIAYG